MSNNNRQKNQVITDSSVSGDQDVDLKNPESTRKHANESLKAREDRFKSIFENSIDVIMIVNNMGNVSFITPSVKKVFGYEPGEVIGKPTFEFGHPDDFEHLWESFEKLLENPGVPFTIEFRTRHKDGSWLMTEATGNNLLNIPEIEGIVVNFHDVTKRRAAEEALNQERVFYRSFVESLSDWVWEMDKEGIHTYSNSAVEDILGYSAEEVIGQHVMILWLEKARTPEQIKSFKRKLKEGTGWKNHQTKFQHKDGSIRIIESTAIPIFDHENRLTGYRGIDRDITRRHHAEEEMKRRLMTFRLEEGSLYLVKEDAPTLSLEAFNDFLKIGHSGLVISRTPEKDFKNQIKGDVEYFWLSEKKGTRTLSPKFKKIEQKIELMYDKKIVLIDRLDYLLSKHDYKEILAFVQRLKELAVILDNTIILSFDPSILNTQELRLLEKEIKEVEPQYKLNLPGQLAEILNFIYIQNTYGIKPSYTVIGQELRLSKPTARKRIRHLVTIGYLRETKKGRTKVLEMTEHGKNFFNK